MTYEYSDTPMDFPQRNQCVTMNLNFEKKKKFHEIQISTIKSSLLLLLLLSPFIVAFFNFKQGGGIT